MRPTMGNHQVYGASRVAAADGQTQLLRREPPYGEDQLQLRAHFGVEIAREQ
jgi:hypothetical protein